MTYYAGIGPRLSGALELLNPGPCVECDKCLAVVIGTTKSGHMAAWLRNDKPPRGWRCLRSLEPFLRRDYCGACWELLKVSESAPREGWAAHQHARASDTITEPK